MNSFQRIYLLLSLAIAALPCFAQQVLEPDPVVCSAGEEDALRSIASRFLNSSGLRLNLGSQIDVTYEGFPEEAKNAFEKAVQIWENILISKVPIKIKASWGSLNGTTLAFSGAAKIFRNTKNAPYKDVWYVGPLAEALAGTDLNDGDPDINITLNSGINWSYATDGSVFSGKYDLITVVLHEIAHGLGVSSSFKLINNDSEAQWGQSGFPYIYDLFVQNGQDKNLTETANFGSPSTELKDQLESGNLFFKIAERDLVSGKPKLYSPRPFKAGGSISHLDESKYPSGSANSLMLPSIPSASAIHDPGEVLLTILNKMGWPVFGLASFEPLATGAEQDILLYPNPAVTEMIYLSFPVQKRSMDTRITLTTMQGQLVYSQQFDTISEPLISINSVPLQAGTYMVQIQTESTKDFKKLIRL